MLHFAKMIREKKRHPSPRRKAAALIPAATQTAPVAKPQKERTKAAVDAQTFKRKFGLELDYVHEREWRVVYHAGSKAFVQGPGVPEYYLPYVPGEELFTLVLPDNKAVSRLRQTDWFTERLFTPWKHYPRLKHRQVPPVTILAHSDLGTF